MSDQFRYQFRVRYSEIDAQGVVFNAHYLTFADVVLTEYWRDIGLHFIGEGALDFHVATATVTYKAPIRSDELVEGRARTVRIGTSSLNTRIELYGTGAEDDLRATIDLVHVHVDLATGKSMPLPDTARAVLMP